MNNQQAVNLILSTRLDALERLLIEKNVVTKEDMDKTFMEEKEKNFKLFGQMEKRNPLSLVAPLEDEKK